MTGNERMRVRCGDCGSFVEDRGDYLRCPWAKAETGRRVVVDEVPTFWCGRPYGNRPDFADVVTGGRIA